MTEEDKILEEIIDHAYTKGEINPQPCSFCGVVECATCLDQVKLLLKKALSKGKEIGIEKGKEIAQTLSKNTQIYYQDEHKLFSQFAVKYYCNDKLPYLFDWCNGFTDFTGFGEPIIYPRANKDINLRFAWYCWLKGKQMCVDKSSKIAELEKQWKMDQELLENYATRIIEFEKELKNTRELTVKSVEQTGLCRTLLKEAHNNLRPCEQRGRTAYSLCHCKPCEINREIEKYLMGEKS